MFSISGIRHPEELSFCKPLEPAHLKHNYKDINNKKNKDSNGKIPADTNTFIHSQSPTGSNGSLDKTISSPLMCAPGVSKNPKSPISKPAITVSQYLVFSFFNEIKHVGNNLLT